MPDQVVLSREEWGALSSAHEQRAEELSRGRLERMARGEKHPVEDFLWDYYPFRPGQLRRWHPGAGVALEGAQERSGWKHYSYDGAAATVDVEAFLEDAGDRLARITGLLRATASRPATFTCFGWHEWCMVYRLAPDELRHRWPLRVGSAATDALVEEVAAGGGVRCSHFDAYRFFTPEARGFNTLSPVPDRAATEQPGCLHAGMDLYKHAFRLLPAVPSALVLRAFELALEIRGLDMRAAPYDLTELGVEPLLMETAEGRAAYVAQQREFSRCAEELRAELLAAAEALTPAA